ncbi:MAG: methyltransferase domain-containing protein [Planctomycetes bacterium]|nr:methyltransferase domain-containing protein [Planctomycetota bacterium]
MNAQDFPVPAPETMLDKLGPIVREPVIIEDRTFLIDHPGQADKLINLPAVHDAFAKDEYMPYWADLWPASRMLAKAILHEPWTPGTEALEVGCGLGLPGIVALSMGLRVTFSDYDACALRFAADNARLNGCTDFRTLQLDWRSPPENLRIGVILASDLVYELRNVAPIVAFIKKVLLPGGVCLLTDQDRIPSHAFKEILQAEGLPFETKMMRAGEPGGRRMKGTLYRITTPA